MITRRRSVGLLTVFGVLAIAAAALHHPQAEELEEDEPAAVSDADLQMYIKVYGAMQENHDLTIDNAIKPYQISLDDFRQLERRIQNQSRLVERVREALLEQAKNHSMFAQAIATPSPVPTTAEPGTRGKNKK